MSKEMLRQWACSTCKAGRSRTARHRDTDSLSEISSCDPDEPSLASVMSKLDAVLRRLDELERRQEEQLTKLDTTNKSIEHQNQTMQGMEASLDLLSSQYDTVLQSLEIQKTELKDIRKETCDLADQLATSNARLQQLETEVDKLETYSRRNNIEIHGIKQSANEDLNVVLASIADKLQLPVPDENEVDAVHRIKGKPSKEPPILVKFFKRATREKWIEKRTALRDEDIFINENLTYSVKKLHWLTKCAAKEKQYRFVWVRNGRIYMRKMEGGTVIRIDKEEDLAKIA